MLPGGIQNPMDSEEMGAGGAKPGLEGNSPAASLGGNNTRENKSRTAVN